MLRRPALVAFVALIAFVAAAASCDGCGDPPVTVIDAGPLGADAGAITDAGAQGIVDAGIVDAGVVVPRTDAGFPDAGAATDAGAPSDAGVVVDSGGSPPPSALRIVGGSGASSSSRFQARVRIGAPLPAVSSTNSSTDGARTLSPSVPESP